MEDIHGHSTDLSQFNENELLIFPKPAPIFPTLESVQQFVRQHETTYFYLVVHTQRKELRLFSSYDKAKDFANGDNATWDIISLAEGELIY